MASGNNNPIEWIKTRDGIVNTSLTVLLTAGTLVEKFTNVAGGLFKGLDLPAWAPGWLGVALAVIAALAWLRNYRRFVSSSRVIRPDLFTLKPESPGALIGRETDLAELVRAVQEHRLVLLDGESGCGKSALVSAGLAHSLPAGMLAVLVRSWGDHLDAGPAGGFLLALYQALDDEQRKRINWSRPPYLADTAETLVGEFEHRCDQVYSVLCLRPLLIADQFDDYQAHQRDAFLANGNWINADTLTQKSVFWRAIRTRLVEKHLHLLVVTRSDVAAGLCCVAFAEVTALARTLYRVDASGLRTLLEGLAKPDDVEVVARPEAGWDALAERVIFDLESGGFVLMQQVKMALSGLTRLPALTVRAYMQHGGLAGVESLVITHAVQRAAGRIGGSGEAVRVARAVLRSFVTDDVQLHGTKSEQRSLAQVEMIAGGADRAQKLLQSYGTQDELLRQVGGTGQTPVYQLDHDYLARAIVEDSARADRWMHRLEEGARRFARAKGSWRERWRALLPVRVLIGVARARWKGGPSLARFRDYLVVSAARPIIYMLLVLTLVTASMHQRSEAALDARAERLISRLDGSEEEQAIYEIWSGSRALRERTLLLLRKDVALLERAFRSRWPKAYTGVDPAAASEVFEVAISDVAEKAAIDGMESSCPSMLVSTDSLKQWLPKIVQRVETSRPFALVANYVDCLTASPATADSVSQGIAQIMQWRKRGLSIDPGLRLRLAPFLRFVSHGGENDKINAMILARELVAGADSNAYFGDEWIEIYGDIASGVTNKAALESEYNELNILESKASSSQRRLLVGLLSKLARYLSNEEDKLSVMRKIVRLTGIRGEGVDWKGYVALVSSLPAENRRSQIEELRTYALQEASVRNFGPISQYFFVAAQDGFKDVGERAVVDGIRLLRTDEIRPSRFWSTYRDVLMRCASAAIVEELTPIIFDRAKKSQLNIDPFSGNADRELRATYVALARKTRDPDRKAALLLELATEIAHSSNELLLESYIDLVSDPSTEKILAAPIAVLQDALARSTNDGSLHTSITLALLVSHIVVSRKQELSTVADPLFVDESLRNLRSSSTTRICEVLSNAIDVPQVAAALLAKLRRQFGPTVSTEAAECYRRIASKLAVAALIDQELLELREKLFATEREGSQVRYQGYTLPYADLVADKFSRTGDIEATDAINLAILLGEPHANAYSRRPLLKTLSTIAGRDFGDSVYEASIWVRAKYPKEAGDLRPPPLH